MFKCKLLCHSVSPHLHQLYTGFGMLHKAGVIALSQEIVPDEVRYASKASHLRDASHAHLNVVLNDSIRLHFDAHDSWEIADSELERCDFYFKRSYSRDAVLRMHSRQFNKIVPLGLNYRVLPDRVDVYAAQRYLALGDSARAKTSGLKQAFCISDRFGFQPRQASLHALPDYDVEPRILFLVAAYDPYDCSDRASDKVEERCFINEMRASCIKHLKKEFGPRFTGGFVPSPFVVRNYNHLVASEWITTQRRFFAAVKASPICIATMGLHGSNGWKLAEYVALSKAIVAEELHYEVPGNFRNGKNYLSFTTPEKCIEQTWRLIKDATLRSAIMANNAAYYRSYLRPDCLVGRALLTSLKNNPIESTHSIRSWVGAVQTA